MKHLIAAICILVVFILGCASPVETKPSDTAPIQVSSDVVVPAPVANEPVQSIVESMSSDVAALLAQREKVVSLKTSVDDGVPGSYTLIVRGDKLKKIYSVPQSYNKETLVTTVYIDRSAKTAVGICDVVFACTREREGKGRSLIYESENPTTPLDIINRVTATKKVGEEKFDNRQTFLLEHILPGGKRERLWVEKFFGVPLQQRVFSGDTLTEKHTFTLTSFNGVLVEDVSLPTSIIVS